MSYSPLRRFFEAYLIAVVLFLLPIMLKERFTLGVGPRADFAVTVIWGPLLFICAGYLISRIHFVLHLLFLATVGISVYLHQSKHPFMDPMRQLTHETGRRCSDGLQLAIVAGLLISCALEFYQRRSSGKIAVSSK